MKEKNLRCKFGMIETSNFGNVNQEGTQESIICRQWLVTSRYVSPGDHIQITSGHVMTISLRCELNVFPVLLHTEVAQKGHELITK